MSAKSTITISRTEALEFIIRNIYIVDNETLADVVEDLNDYLGEYGDENYFGLYNFYVE